MEFISVTDFWEFQYYARRRPPWIALHSRILGSYRFAKLSGASKWQYIGMLLLASQTDNKIPADPSFIQGRINSIEPVDLDTLLTSGLIVEWKEGETMHAPCMHRAAKVWPIDRDIDKDIKSRRRHSAADFFSFSGENLKVKTVLDEKLRAEFPGFDIAGEYPKMDKWLAENQDKPCKNVASFVRRWLVNNLAKSAESKPTAAKPVKFGIQPVSPEGKELEKTYR